MLIKSSKRLKLHGKNMDFVPAQPIFVSEQLTPFMMSLYRQAIDLRNSEIIKYVWISEGKLFIRMNEDSPAIRVKEIFDLPFPDSNTEDEQLFENEEPKEKKIC